MPSYPIFTANETNTSFVLVDSLTLKGAGVKIPAIIIGEQGRGRERGVLPIKLLPEAHKEWEVKGTTKIKYASIEQTKSGKPKLFQKSQATDTDKCIVVFRTKIGFRGGNSHTGDRINPQEPKEGFLPFPGEPLVSGRIAQGAAGRAGSGSQIVALMPRNTIFRTGYSGRLYGAPAAHYHFFNGEEFLSLTWEERTASDLF